MKYIYEESVQDPKLTAQFREYLQIQRGEFQVELQKQQVETKREIEEQRRIEREEREAIERLEEVHEEADDAFSYNSDKQKHYDMLMKGTEMTESVHKVQFASQDEFKNEKNSDDVTYADIPVITSEDGTSKKP